MVEKALRRGRGRERDRLSVCLSVLSHERKEIIISLELLLLYFFSIFILS